MEEIIREIDGKNRFICRQGQIGFIVDAEINNKPKGRLDPMYLRNGIHIFSNEIIGVHEVKLLDFVIPENPRINESFIAFTVPSIIDYSGLLIPLFISNYLNKKYSFPKKLEPFVNTQHKGGFELDVRIL